MKLFFDCEFTGLEKDCDLISIGFVTDNGKQFYAENNEHIAWNDWIDKNVVPHLKFADVSNVKYEGNIQVATEVMIKGNLDYIAEVLDEWLKQFDSVEIWSDVLAYDWMLFCDLFGGAMKIPDNVYYIPFDIATLMKVKGVDPDINREDYCGVRERLTTDFGSEAVNRSRVDWRIQHNALWDAQVIRMCYDKLMIGDNPG